MNQYIITEEHCKNEGRCIDFTFAPSEWRENDICHLCGCDGDTRSHPYNPQAEREKVLDKILNHILDDMGVEIHERDGEKYFVISGTFSVSELILYLQSLRQSKESEL